jgi:undecaprenyl-diphosphatase
MDHWILDFIQLHLRSGILDRVMVFVTTLGNMAGIWVLWAVILLMFKETRRCGVMMLFTLLAGAVLGNLIIKPLVMRARPFELFGTGDLFHIRVTGYSFPSGHTLSSFSMVPLLWREERKMGIFALILAAAIAFSRIYLYVHYPSDIFGGMVLGLSVAMFTIWLFENYRICQKMK